MNAAQRRIHDAALKLFAQKGATEVSVSELAQAANVARGTIYNNLEEPEHLFQQVAAQLADEMDERIATSYRGIDDPAIRTAMGIRLYVRRAHEEPHWGRFLVQFAYTNDSLRKLFTGPPMRDLQLGLKQKRFTFRPEQGLAGLGLIAGVALSAILGVLEGLRTWRDAGSDAAELALRALGVPAKEAQRISVMELPPLAEAD
jgi:AcrR family transcriptional regulator